MSHFPAAEAHGGFHPVPVGEELLGVFELGVEVIGVYAGRHANLLYFNDPLILLCFLLLLGLLKTELAIVHDAADRGGGARSDFDQVKLMLDSDLKSLLRGHNTQLLALRAYKAHFLVNNLLVDLMNSVCDLKHLR